MTNKEKALMLEVRLSRLKNNGRNEDSDGVIRKLERQIRNLNSK